MDTTVAVHRTATALALVLAAMAMMAREDPEMLVLLAIVCANPGLVVSTLLAVVLSMPEATPERRN